VYSRDTGGGQRACETGATQQRQIKSNFTYVVCLPDTVDPRGPKGAREHPPDYVGVVFGGTGSGRLRESDVGRGKGAAARVRITNDREIARGCTFVGWRAMTASRISRGRPHAWAEMWRL